MVWDFKGEEDSSCEDGKENVPLTDVCWAILTVGHREDFDQKGSACCSLAPCSYYTPVTYAEGSLPGAGPLSNSIAQIERRSKILLESFISYKLKIIKRHILGVTNASPSHMYFSLHTSVKLNCKPISNPYSFA